MGELGNFFTVCVIFGNIVRFAGTLTAQTRQDSETTHTGRTPHPPSFAPALAVNRLRASSSLVCYSARSPLRGLLAPYGALCEHSSTSEPKPCGFASFRRCQLAGGGVWAGLWDCVWWVYSWCIGGMVCGVWELMWSWACG